MKFSICIPNFNYEKYLWLTLDSAVNQEYRDFEIVIADNASTDRSVEIIKRYATKYSNIKYKINTTNLGFAGNLDEVGRMAEGQWRIMLSSDDLITSGALKEYDKFINIVSGQISKAFIFCSAFEKIDSAGGFLGYISASQSTVWSKRDINDELSVLMGFPVYMVSSSELLRRCLTRFLTPFNFAATCYQAKAYKDVGGYGGGRVFNPDKWFAWKILSKCDYAFYLDKPLFKYRLHDSNQASIQKNSGVLKHWLDDYRNCFEIDDNMLQNTGLSRSDITKAFISHSILPNVLSNLKKGNLRLAHRIMLFGCCTYPDVMHKAKYYYRLRILLSLGPIGAWIARRYKHHRPRERWHE